VDQVHHASRPAAAILAGLSAGRVRARPATS